MNNVPYVTASTPQLIVGGEQNQIIQPTFVQSPYVGQQFAQQIPVAAQTVQIPIQHVLVQQNTLQNTLRPGSPIQQHIIPQQNQAESFLSLGNKQSTVASPSYGVQGNVLEGQQQLQQRLIQHRGIPAYHPDNLANTIYNRNGGYQQHQNPADYSKVSQNYPTHIPEHIQRRPFSVLDQYQDTEGLDVIRVQASRISNLLDRIEILEKEVERQADLLTEKDDNIDFWTKQYEQLEFNRKQALQTLSSFAKLENKQYIIDSMEDKTNVEKELTLKLREIEDLNTEIAYWKSQCVPNEESSLEVKRLQKKQEELSDQNNQLNKQLIVIGHQQRTQ
ncbi:hypothetical protein TTHERM_00372420 (macronuclear) [Tetrahymena thermophila SB210]|uniref:Uncharacterized protein n=1 Tax=Tetrahymena thermophila (strain SB210) TaxID=312017 RepID=I7MHR3_TETTS|nr:hypothetical protein TTHERM_00372420 [Tetrahymena thermophila SB210]EAR89325.3 hypothetical protein TTHERM_00372420 [Tetrahymena thermophila SB210]|eukprot:XP_001009570.3 hypothetical protein TTHERM_00372420 [Tetrahymena thermophila SB210]